MAEKPEDDVKDVHDEPDKGESPAETLERHEELHREHRSRIDALCKHVGMPGDDASDVHDEPDRIRNRRRHD